jgi:hypothetical protein
VTESTARTGVASRRQFLQNAALGAAALALVPAQVRSGGHASGISQQALPPLEVAIPGRTQLI